jgi:molybdopterin biosynthesis enzyme
VDHARLTGTQSSGALTSMLRANALLIVPEGQHECHPGEQFRAIPLRDSVFRSAVFPA